LDNLTSFNGRVYFGADGHLWRSDGTALGTKVLKTSRGALVKAPFEMAATDSLLFYQFNDSKVWRTNGTANGTFKVLDQGPGCTYDCSPMSLTADGNLMYFEADELYRSDGTASGTFAVGPYSDSSPTTMLGAGDLFYFHAADDELWATDGTPSSGHTLNKGTADHCCWEMADASGTLYFTGPLTGTDTSKLFRYDENTNTTTEMGPTSAEEPYFLTVVGNRLFFAAHDSRGHELWAVNL
jgi:ELWxxDGT repeat protein